MKKILDLDKRIPIANNPVDTIDKCRAYDADVRTSMIIPMARVVSLLTTYCRKDSNVLAVGCKTGLLSLQLLGQVPDIHVYGVEENDLFLQVAEENATLASLVNDHVMVEFQYAPLDDLYLEDNSVDIVFSFSSFHTWRDPEKTLRECNRICKDDGLVYIYDLDRDAEQGMISFIMQYMAKGHEEFMRELKAAYTVEEVAGILREAGLEQWVITSEAVNMAISSKKAV